MDNNSKIFHIDLANQVANLWTKDSILGLVCDSIKYSVKIKAKDKLIIKKKKLQKSPIIIKKSKHYSNEIAATIYSYLLFKIIQNNQNLLANCKVSLCNDAQPQKTVHSMYQRILAHENCSHFKHNIKIKFRRKKDDGRKSPAHKYVNNIHRGREKSSYTLSKYDLDKINHYITNFVENKYFKKN